MIFAKAGYTTQEFVGEELQTVGAWKIFLVTTKISRKGDLIMTDNNIK